VTTATAANAEPLTYFFGAANFTYRIGVFATPGADCTDFTHPSTLVFEIIDKF
jgi:hypothetical protein